MADKEIEVNERPNSCEISINAKGQWSGKVKCYADTSKDAMSDAMTRAQELEKVIAKKNQKPED